MVATRLTAGRALPVAIMLALVLGWALALCGQARAAEQDRPPFYHFSKGGKQVFLLGAVHMGNADFYPLPSDVERAFAAAGTLVVEADVSRTDVDLSALLERYGASTAGPDTATAASLERYCLRRQPLCDTLAAYAPWLQASQISALKFSALGYTPQQGVDLTLLRRALGHKSIVELEGVEEQFRLLSSLDISTQWLMVRQAIDTEDKDIISLIDSWRHGDIDRLTSLLQASMTEGAADEEQSLLKALLWDRNEHMVSRLLALLDKADTPATVLVVVGAAHLVGRHSLVSLLGAQQIRVTSPLGHCGAVDEACR